MLSMQLFSSVINVDTNNIKDTIGKLYLVACNDHFQNKNAFRFECNVYIYTYIRIYIR